MKTKTSNIDRFLKELKNSKDYNETWLLRRLKKMARPPILFYHKSMEDLARETAAMSNLELGEIKWEYFSDSMPKTAFVTEFSEREVIFLSAFNNKSDWPENMGVINALTRMDAASMHVIVPYYSVGTMEWFDYDHEKVVATAMTLARELSTIPHCTPAGGYGGGPAKITVFDIHALQGRFYFSDNVVPHLTSTMPLYLKVLEKLDKSKIGICFPDAGAWKRFQKWFKGYYHIICSKQRMGANRIIRIEEGDPSGLDVYEIDDLVMTGGTGIETRHALMAGGANSVSFMAPHGVFPEMTWKKYSKDIFKNVFITNSCPGTVAEITNDPDYDHFKIISLSSRINAIV